MHELSVTESILAISLKHGELVNAQAITDIHVVVGQLSSFIDESIQMYWDIISADTLAEGAMLHFRRIPAEVRCQYCDSVYPLSTVDFICPRCSSVQGEIISGDDLYVESIEIIEGKHHEEAECSSY